MNINIQLDSRTKILLILRPILLNKNINANKMKNRQQQIPITVKHNRISPQTCMHRQKSKCKSIHAISPKSISQLQLKMRLNNNSYSPFHANYNSNTFTNSNSNVNTVINSGRNYANNNNRNNRSFSILTMNSTLPLQRQLFVTQRQKIQNSQPLIIKQNINNNNSFEANYKKHRLSQQQINDQNIRLLLRLQQQTKQLMHERDRLININQQEYQIMVEKLMLMRKLCNQRKQDIKSLQFALNQYEMTKINNNREKVMKFYDDNNYKSYYNRQRKEKNNNSLNRDREREYYTHRYP